jgi:tetratricopeptide (TPR) repeat protein
MEARWTLGAVRADRKAACADLRVVVDWYRHKAETDPALLLPLGQVLSDLGNALKDIEEFGEALKMLEESVTTLEWVQTTRPEAAEEFLSVALLNLGVAQAQTGRAQRGLKTTERAVTLLRKRGHPWLLLALINLNIGLASLGRQREALAALLEAQQLQQIHPDVYPSHVVVVLIIYLGITFFNLGEIQAAQEKLKEVITVLNASNIPLETSTRQDLQSLYHALSPSLPASLAESAAALFEKSYQVVWYRAHDYSSSEERRLFFWASCHPPLRKMSRNERI